MTNDTLTTKNTNSERFPCAERSLVMRSAMVDARKPSALRQNLVQEDVLRTSMNFWKCNDSSSIMERQNTSERFRKTSGAVKIVALLIRIRGIRRKRYWSAENMAEVSQPIMECFLCVTSWRSGWVRGCIWFWVTSMAIGSTLARRKNLQFAKLHMKINFFNYPSQRALLLHSRYPMFYTLPRTGWQGHVIASKSLSTYTLQHCRISNHQITNRVGEIITIGQKAFESENLVVAQSQHYGMSEVFAHINSRSISMVTYKMEVCFFHIVWSNQR